MLLLLLLERQGGLYDELEEDEAEADPGAEAEASSELIIMILTWVNVNESLTFLL